MDPITLAVGALIQPFLGELVGAGRDVAREGGARAGKKLKDFAFRIWDRLLGPGEGDARLSNAAAAAAEGKGNGTAQAALFEELQRVVTEIGLRDRKFIEAELRAAEAHGGPKWTQAGDISQTVIGDRNITIGQNSGDARIAGPS